MEVKFGIETKMKLNAGAMKQFSVAKIFQETDAYTTSLTFSNNGKHLVVLNHEYLTVFNSISFKKSCKIPVHKYHPESVCFTTQANQVLHNATKFDFAIRCLDLESHQHLRLFTGHSKSIRGLCFQPGSENDFISTGDDNHVYMWDLRSPKYTKHLDKLESPLVAYDPAGLVFAVSSSTTTIDIQDVRMINETPCQKFSYQLNTKVKWTQLQFSPDGKTIMVGTDNSWCFSVDAFNGEFRQAFTGYANEERVPLQASYTPDSQFILSGADNGRVHVWDASSGESVVVLHGNSMATVRFLQFNPRHTMFVSSDALTLFWQPKAIGHYDFVQQNIPIIDLTASDESDPQEDVEFLEQLQTQYCDQIEKRRQRYRRNQ